jgi:hypothetical protein
VHALPNAFDEKVMSAKYLIYICKQIIILVSFEVPTASHARIAVIYPDHKGILIHQHISNRIKGATSQKTVIFTLAPNQSKRIQIF